ncbi:MAG: hypothetical protein ABI460_07365 [Caldimonas sp.]
MKITKLLPIVLLTTAFSGCVVAPVAPAYGAPPGVVYVAPTYAVPGPGYVWAYHARFGWGWHHPQYGWHRGWR